MVLQKDQFVLEDSTSAQPDFDLKAYRAISVNGSLSEESMFIPIKELARIDADVYLVFLSTNAVVFSQPSDDLWYPAHDLGVNITDASIESMSLYFGDEPASPLGCVRQYQFCSGGADGSRCTPLSSLLDAHRVAYTRWAQDEPYWDTLRWMASAVRGTQDPLFGSIESLGSAVLESSSRKVAGIMGPLSRDQWQLDVEKWYNISLASIQQNFVEIAAGPSDGRLRDWAVKPANDGEKRFCNNQKVRNTAYTNFSVFGLAMLLGVGFLIIVISYTLEPFAIWIQHRRNLDTYARLEWTMNDTLQLQRLAHEELGLGNWHRCDTDVPVTERLERLGVMDLSERTHPRLKAPPVSFEETVNESDENEEQKCKTEVKVGDSQEVPTGGNFV
ncbi:Cytochrome p450 protein [Lasiodiplodia theobromae]|uniref:Cytochrome p450 protein n=1 Tax=Lasiodiplodia theobromae TaxID=45133 RepID=UPI0015C33608|nr:Cytochrome p450 protein [Lasiodiplodia theobromae]KAF4537697.1 Cytochrome p450 protein [Lasiodiplodia theobromae]